MALSLDTVSPDSNPNVAALERPASAMPPEKHLDMPTQSLRHWSSAEERKPVLQHPRLGTWLARLFVFGGGLLLTAYGTYEMYQVVSVSRTTVLQWVLVGLFTVNFSWIALPSPARCSGFLAAPEAPRPSRPPARHPAAPNRDRHAGLQRADRPHLRGPRGDLRVGPGDRASASISIISSSPTRRIRMPGSPRSAPSWP